MKNTALIDESAKQIANHYLHLHANSLSSQELHADFEEQAQELLKLNFYRSIVLLDKNFTIHASVGLPVSAQRIRQEFYKNTSTNKPYYGSYIFTPFALHSNTKGHSRSSTHHSSVNHNSVKSKSTNHSPTIHSDQTHVSHNSSVFEPMSHDNISYYSLVVTDNAAALIMNYQWIIIILSLFSGSIAIAILYHYKIKHSIFGPRNQLNNRLQETIQQQKIHTIPTEKLGIFTPIVLGINQLLLIQKDMQNQLQQNIDSATKELRESLETLEVRNIELDIARKKALELTTLKSEFLANTSHEIKTPLSGILGFSELLKKTPLNLDQREYLTTIEDSARGLLTVINDIFDFSRMETGKLNLDHKTFDLIDTVEDSLLLQASYANEKGIKVHFIPDNSIPKNVLGDPIRLQQVISNLVVNALKFSDSGRVTVYIHRLHRDDNKVELKFVVQDDGIGLDISDSSQLFDSFSQVQTGSNRSHSGTGLGLTIARGLVQRMHGQIGVESTKGEGSSFWFTIVLGQSGEPNTPPKNAGTLTNVHVLLFDTEDIGRFELSSKLNLWGATSHAVDSFSHIIGQADALVKKSKTNSQFHPAAIIDAQTSTSIIDTPTLKLTIAHLSQKLGIPTIVIAPPGKYRLIEPLIADTKTVLLQRPLKSTKLYHAIFDQLGIFKTIPQLRLNTHNIRENLIRILLVDDNRANLKLANELLKDFATKVDTASSGVEALSLQNKNSYDIILMDIQMPDMDGYTTTQKIRENENGGSRTPIIALTAHAVAEEKAKILLSGMDDFLSKPICNDDINHIFDRWVTRKKNTHKTTATVYTSTKIPASSTKITEHLPYKPTLSEQLGISEHDTLETPGISVQEGTPEPYKTLENKQTDIRPPAHLHIQEVNPANMGPVNIQQSISLAKNKPDLAKEMLEMLLNDLPAEREAIIRNHKNKAYSQLQEVIHKIRGGSCYCGVPVLLATTSVTDSNLKEHEIHNLDNEINDIIRAIDQLIQWHDEHDLDAMFDIDK